MLDALSMVLMQLVMLLVCLTITALGVGIIIGAFFAAKLAITFLMLILGGMITLFGLSMFCDALSEMIQKEDF